MKNLRKYLVLGIILALSLFFLYVLRPYYVAMLSSIVLFALFNPFYKFLVNKVFKKKKILCASLTLAVIFLVVIIPIVGLSSLVVNEAVDLSSSFSLEEIYSLTENIVGEELIDEAVSRISSGVFDYIKSSFSAWIESVVNFFVSIVMLLFLLYFMFTKSDKLDRIADEYLPFSKKNIKELVKKFKETTYGTVYGSGLIALIQGILLGVGFLIFGIEGVLVWGLITAVLSFIPALGAPMVYIPAGLILIWQQDYFGGFGILIWGIVLVSSVDNVLRPILGKKLAKTHPLVTLFGVVVGIKYFGIVGVIIGPLLLSYLFLILKIYKKEYT